MKEFNKEEYNKMCANLLGWTLKYGWYNPDMSHVHSFMAEEDLKFHSNWNWIMEVVEKISNWANANVEKYNSYFWGTEPKVDFLIFRLSKDNLVTAIWEFLNWYKTQTP